MLQLPKNPKVPPSVISVFPSRVINQVHEILRGMQGWSFKEEAAEVGQGFNEDELYRHTYNDSDGPVIIAARNQRYGIPTPPAIQFQDGTLARLIKDALRQTGMPDADTLRRMEPEMRGAQLKSEVAAFTARLGYHSSNPYHLARCLEVLHDMHLLCHIRMVPSWTFLKADDPRIEKRARRARQLRLPLEA